VRYPLLIYYPNAATRPKLCFQMNQPNNRIRISTLLIFILTAAFAQAQTITLTRFNNTATYFPGASISVHLNPDGVFTTSNQFILELSDATGSFAAPTTIATASEFFIPVLNGTLPAGLAAGTGYQLRVRSTAPAITSAATSAFTVQAATAFTKPTITLNTTPRSIVLLRIFSSDG
jgi:hypothetical protein